MELGGTSALLSRILIATLSKTASQQQGCANELQVIYKPTKVTVEIIK